MGKASRKKKVDKFSESGRDKLKHRRIAHASTEDKINRNILSSHNSSWEGKVSRLTSKLTPPRMTIIIVLVSVAVYFNALFNGFVLYCDAQQILHNSWIKDVRFIPDFFTSDVWRFQSEGVSNWYRPMVSLIYMLNYYVFGLKPLGFHLVNIIFHAGVSALVFLVSLRLLAEFQSLSSHWYVSAPFWAAVMFAIHPIHTEAVTWVAALPDVSCTFFYLLSFYLYIRFREGFGKGYLLSIASFFVATLCKEPAVTLPFILVAYDYIFRNTNNRFSVHLKKYVPYLFATGVYFVLRFNALGGFAPHKRYEELNIYQMIINLFPLFTKYLEKLFFPLNLNAYHVLHPITSIFEMKGILSLAITTIFIIVTFIALKRNRGISFSLLLIVIPLLPVFYLPGLGDNAFTERYLYLPSFGFVILLALLLVRVGVKFANGNTIMAAALIVLSGLYSTGTVIRNSDWKDDLTLFTDMVRKSPDGDLPHHYLGIAYADRGRFDEAINEYKTVLRLDAENPNISLLSKTYYDLGKAYRSKGQLDMAIEQTETALRLKPDFVKAHNNLGNMYASKGQLDMAIEQYQTVLRLKPDFVEAHNNLGVMYASKGQLDMAIEQYQTALRLKPDSAEAHFNLGLIYLNKGTMDMARREFELGLRIAPDNYEVRKILNRIISTQH